MSRARSRAVVVASVLIAFIAVPAFAGLYSDLVQGDHPAAYLRLGETSGTTAFDSADAHDGTYLNGVALNQPGAIIGDPDPAAGFDGANDKVDVPFSAQLNPPFFTVELWARLDGGGGHRSPLTSRDDRPQRGYMFYAAPNNRWEFWNGRGNGWHGLGGPGAAFGEWYHLVGTYDAATQTKKFYVNGSLVGQATVPLPLNTARPLRIGAGATEGGGNYFFNGLVDEVAIYDRPLSGPEIASHFWAGRFGPRTLDDLLIADFSNPGVGPGGTPLGPDVASMVLAGVTGSHPTPINPDGMLVMTGGGTGGLVFEGALPPYDFEQPLVIQTQAFFRDHNAPGGQANAYMGLIGLHTKGVGSSGPDRRGGLWAQFQPYTNGTGHIRLGYQSDTTSGGDWWVDNLFARTVSGFTNANGVFDLELALYGLEDDDRLLFTVSQGAFQASIDTTLGAYRAALGARSIDALQAFDASLNQIRLDPTAMNVGIISTSTRNDAYNYLFVRGNLIPEPMSIGLIGLGLLALARRRRRKN